jgi:lycopene beta-cyclase
VWTDKPLKHKDIVKKVWTNARFVSPDGEECTKDMGTYSYQQIRSLQFYDKLLNPLFESPNVDIKYTEVLEVHEGSHHTEIKTKDGIERAKMVFDSRIDFRNYTPPAIDDYNYATQHFYGYFIETNDPVFDGDTFTMMDFSYPADENEFGFVYVLPYDSTSALVELTYFSNNLKSDEEYSQKLEEYIANNITSQYKILEVEKNKIPMLDKQIPRHQKGRILKIGTNGGMTKVSTGYTFTRVMADSLKTADFLQSNPETFKGFELIKKVPLHDRIILTVLLKEPMVGMKLFYKLFNELKPEVFFGFLDDKLNIFQLLSIYIKAPIFKFTKYALKTIFTSNK